MKTIVLPQLKHQLSKPILQQITGIEEIRTVSVFNSWSTFQAIETNNGYLIHYVCGPIRYTALIDFQNGDIEIINFECNIRKHNSLATLLIGIIVNANLYGIKTISYKSKGKAKFFDSRPDYYIAMKYGFIPKPEKITEIIETMAKNGLVDFQLDELFTPTGLDDWKKYGGGTSHVFLIAEKSVSMTLFKNMLSEAGRLNRLYYRTKVIF